MCGICGFYSKQNISENELNKMNDTMIHRGPDDTGSVILQLGNNRIGLAHRRLSIVDLSTNGRQPMKSDDGNILLVFNGEIYNYKELRSELSHYPYHSNTDTEVIIAAIQQWGMNFIHRCNGMYSMAVFNAKDDTLYLIRDRMGQKPLYYYFNDGELVFASELKAIMEYPGIKLCINKNVLGKYLAKNYISSPDSIFENVYKVKPGEIVRLKDGCLMKNEYWNVKKKYYELRGRYKKGYNCAKNDIKALLQKSVQYRMISDVPVGVLLSGGYDSSLIAYYAAHISPHQIQTYTIGMEDKKLDEVRYAKEIAYRIGAQNSEEYISKKDMLRIIQDIPDYYDEPFSDSSQIATMMVYELAGKDSKVILSGDGADEFFAGYSSYRRLKFLRWMYPFSYLYCRFLGGKTKCRHSLGYVMSMIGNGGIQYGDITKIQFIRKILRTSNGENYDVRDLPAGDWSRKKMILDLSTYLPDDIFCKIDRASMMHSVEGRSPFVDVDLIEFALSLPHRYKISLFKGKRIIKDIAWELLGRDALDRPKQGFEVPIERWLREDLREQTLALSRREYLRDQGIFEPVATERLIDSYMDDANSTGHGNITMLIWAFYMFQIWYERYREKIQH